jgi:hypothetical protein
MWQPGSEVRFAERFEQKLTELAIEFVRLGNLGGYRFDYVLRAPGGDVLGVDLQMWNLDSNPIRYGAEMRSLRRAIPNSYIVVDIHPPGQLPEGVVAENDFYDFLLNQKKKPRGGIRGDAPIDEVSKVDLPLFLAAMPFAPKYSDTFSVGITSAAKAANATSDRIDRNPFTGDIVARIKRDIISSAGVVADVSESNPNVLYEVGYAHASDIPVILICSTEFEKLPFDIAHENTIAYEIGQVNELIPKIEGSMRAVLRQRRT